MGVLLTAYQARYSTQLRKQVSNPQLSTNSSIDTTREGYAETDITAEFAKRGITLDTTADTHITTGVNGIYARLCVITGQPGGFDRWKEFTDDLKLLAETTSRDRIMASTDSEMNPTSEPANSTPAGDLSVFKGYIPKNGSYPTGSSSVTGDPNHVD